MCQLAIGKLLCCLINCLIILQDLTGQCFPSSHIDSKNTLHIGDLLLRFFDLGFFVNRLHLSLVSRLGGFDHFTYENSLGNVRHRADSIFSSSNVKNFCCFQLSGGLDVHNIHFLYVLLKETASSFNKSWFTRGLLNLF
jgi:hypothetical protein